MVWKKEHVHNRNSATFSQPNTRWVTLASLPRCSNSELDGTEIGLLFAPHTILKMAMIVLEAGGLNGSVNVYTPKNSTYPLHHSPMMERDGLQDTELLLQIDTVDKRRRFYHNVSTTENM